MVPSYFLDKLPMLHYTICILPLYNMYIPKQERRMFYNEHSYGYWLFKLSLISYCVKWPSHYICVLYHINNWWINLKGCTISIYYVEVLLTWQDVTQGHFLMEGAHMHTSGQRTKTDHCHADINIIQTLPLLVQWGKCSFRITRTRYRLQSQMRKEQIEFSVCWYF